MSYEKEKDERSEINRDHVVVRGCEKVRSEERGVCHAVCIQHPLTAKAVPTPFGSPVIGGQKSL